MEVAKWRWEEETSAFNQRPTVCALRKLSKPSEAKCEPRERENKVMGKKIEVGKRKKEQKAERERNV